MPHDSPNVDELVRTAQEFITSITPSLAGEERYQALCATYLLDIVRRELPEWAPIETADDRRLQALLGDQPRPPDQLTTALSAAIRDGVFDQRMDELLGSLIEHVESKVAVTKPSYLSDSVDE